jgi:hypothetical protein
MNDLVPYEGQHIEGCLRPISRFSSARRWRGVLDSADARPDPAASPHPSAIDRALQLIEKIVARDERSDG